MESYEVLGIFGMRALSYKYLLLTSYDLGWFFGDFFMEEFPAHLEYTGIYRCVYCGMFTQISLTCCLTQVPQQSRVDGRGRLLRVGTHQW